MGPTHERDPVVAHLDEVLHRELASADVVDRVNQQLRAQAARAVGAVIERLYHGRTAPARIILRTQLVICHTTGPASPATISRVRAAHLDARVDDSCPKC
ncbi:MAG TPA: hypothetical protein VIW24_21935 [Aldersonia sp.]